MNYKHETWQVVDTYGDYHEYSPERPCIIVWDGDEQASGPVCDMGDMGDLDYADRLQKAKLIAAAPELLRALMLCMSLLSDGYVDADVSPTMKIANAAFKKATE